MKLFSESESPVTEGKQEFRDLIICHIIGLQNDRYWQEESEGYKALQELLELVIDRYGDFGREWGPKRDG